jgi:tRNA pseudouridine32 synthase/23S rRNA pseudouridine746 synthase
VKLTATLVTARTALVNELSVLYVDAAMLMLDKPVGLLSVPGRGPDKQDCLSARAQRLYPDALVVHRLDMATSGLMLMARGAETQRLLSAAFASRTISKSYIAVVDGLVQAPAEAWGVIDLPIAVDWPNRPRSVVNHQNGKPSVTHWRVISHDKQQKTTRIELEPVTGRSHQLRVHLQALGHSIVGDLLYGNAPKGSQATRMLLHAQALELRHPTSDKPIRFCSAAPF